jgi:AcrR family transcriptional regulator
MSKSEAKDAEPTQRAAARSVAKRAPEKATARPRRSQAERSEDTKRRIVEAAARLIVRKGYVELRVADIAYEAGVSIGAQLHHFPNKDALVIAVIEHSFAEASRSSRRRAEFGSASGEILEDIIDDAKAFFFSEHFLIALNVVLSTLSPSAMRDDVLRISRGARLPVEEAWGKAMIAAGYPKELTSELITLTFCLVRGFAIRQLWDDDEQWQEHCFALWRDMIQLLLEKHRGSASAGEAPKGCA